MVMELEKQNDGKFRRLGEEGVSRPRHELKERKNVKE